MFSDTPAGPPDIQEGIWKGRPVRYRADRIIVAFNPAALSTYGTLEQLAESIIAVIPDGRLIRLSLRSGRAIFGVAPTADIIELADALSARDEVDYAEPDLVDSTA